MITSNPPRDPPPRGLAIPLLTLALLTGCASESVPPEGAGSPPPPAVTVQTIKPERVELREEYAGRARGFREVEVRARVEGILLKRKYVEGAVVERGDKLFRIDPEPFEVALRRAEAELANANAGQRQAEREWRRVADLFEENAVSARERDQALSALELSRARTAMARTQVSQAEIDLSYTEVNAPLPGATSLDVLDEGSLVRPGDLLTRITQLDPVHILFSIPEGDAKLQRKAMLAMTADGNGGSQGARVILPDGKRYRHDGVVNYTESTIDSSTGTVQVRAVFPNPRGELIPGQFVRISVQTRPLAEAIVVPEQAVASGSGGPVVYVVGADDTARARPVTLGALIPDGQIIAQGLQRGERIIVRGIVKVSDGAKVNPESPGQPRDRAA